MSFPSQPFLYNGNPEFPLTHLPHSLCLWKPNSFSIIYQFHLSFQVSIPPSPLPPPLHQKWGKEKNLPGWKLRPCKYKKKDIKLLGQPPNDQLRSSSFPAPLPLL